MSRKYSNVILAETLGWDVSEVNECRYQLYSYPTVFSIDDRYFAVAAKKPRHEVGGPWRQHADQFFAGLSNTIVWVCDMAKGDVE